MIKKYESTDETITLKDGVVLHRIRALKSFGDITKGDLGGWIEKEDNLSHNDNAWVYDNAKVYDNACIYDNAKVYGNACVYNDACVSSKACVYGNAKVYNKAKVHDNAWVCDNAWVHDNAWVYGNACVYENACVGGKTCVYNDARVYGYAKVYGYARAYGYAKVYGNACILDEQIIGIVSLPYKDIFQHQCKERMLTAILTLDNRILYTIGCQENITEEIFLDRIYNENGGLNNNPHREEYLRLIDCIKLYFNYKDK